MKRSGKQLIKSNLTFKTITMEKIKKLIVLISSRLTSTTHVFGILAIAVGALLLIYDVRYLLYFGGGWDYINNIIVEAHGLFFDLLVLGVLISIYERKREKRETIKKEKNLIHDYRGWDEKEATHRIVGAIRRLNKENVTKISLYGCFLQEAKLMTLNLTGADFFLTNLKRANLTATNLTRATFCGTNLTQANLTRANLTRANLIEANLTEANLTEANLTEANLTEAILRSTNLTGVNLKKALVYESWFEKLDIWVVKGREEIKEKYRIDENGRLQLK